jgi:hypothetical protein
MYTKPIFLGLMLSVSMAFEIYGYAFKLFNTADYSLTITLRIKEPVHQSKGLVEPTTFTERSVEVPAKDFRFIKEQSMHTWLKDIIITRQGKRFNPSYVQEDAQAPSVEVVRNGIPMGKTDGTIRCLDNELIGIKFNEKTWTFVLEWWSYGVRIHAGENVSEDGKVHLTLPVDPTQSDSTQAELITAPLQKIE